VNVRVRAVEYIRRMRGGSQAKLMRCSDRRYYVVKFQNNPQGARILANDLLGTLLAQTLGLPVSEPAIVNVEEGLIRFTEELVICTRCGQVPCSPGLCFGSRYPIVGRTPRIVYDFLPDDFLGRVLNLSDFLGMLVFDKWTGNTDNRQVVFIQEAPPDNGLPYYTYRALMIDQGNCFDGDHWTFADAPRRGIYFKRKPYAKVESIEAFEPWLRRLECGMTRGVLEQLAQEIPPGWYAGDKKSMSRLLGELDSRRTKVRDILEQTLCAVPDFFPSWRSGTERFGCASLNQFVGG
jgi:hypothetical protein